jgi:hypothetical protein
VPSDTELFWHAVSHPLGHAEETGRTGTRLRFWLDAAALLAAGAEIDWERVRARIASRECSRPTLARAWIGAASELAGVALPAGALGSESVTAFNVERMVSWRLRVFSRHAGKGRWSRTLIEEGARGEAGLPVSPAQGTAPMFARLRHALVSCVARGVWLVGR